ncbi:MAG: PKD domain-containing protein [Prevotella sp.]|nr:PKD domain-containing protein [Prevotella sp.]
MMNQKNLVLAALIGMAAGAHAQSQDITVLELHPAPGQFVNTLPKADGTSTHEEVCRKATESLRNGELIHLGTYGGYITVAFDHPVKNLRGSDLRITGNGFYAAADPVYGKETIGGSFEPGIVYVGVGDDVETAEWYELAGSEYYTTEIHDFSITYHKPTAEAGEHTQFASTYDNYIRWEATWTENGERRDSTGYHMKNQFHNQTYWPLWEEGETLTFSGGKLPNNAVEQSGKGTYWVLYRYAPDAYGYVDASLNSDDYSTFDIDWAVDADGRPVELGEVNFIRVACGIFQYCGWLGETSTEVSGFQDLHLVEGYDDNPIVITPRRPTGIGRTGTAARTGEALYDLTGRRVATPARGIYIRNGKKIYIN